MFDLFRSQRQSVRYLLGGILMFVAFSMVITLVPGLFSSPTGVDPLVLVEVGDYDVTIPDINLRLRGMSQGETIAPADLEFQARNLLDQAVTNRVLLDEADKLGFGPDEQEVAEWLAFQFPMLFEEGKFVGQDRYAAFVANRYKLSVPQFEDQFRREMLVSLRLRRLVEDSVRVYEGDLKEAYRRKNEKAKVEYVQVRDSRFKDQVKVTEEEIVSYYEENKERYRTFALLHVQSMTLKGGWQPDIEVTDAQMRHFYSQNREQYETGERVRASHILFSTLDLEEEAIPPIRAKAEEVLREIKDGADFAEKATEHSEDEASAENGGDLGWVTRGQMVTEFEDKAFGLPVGEMSDLVETEYGFHIVKVHEKDAPRVRAFEEVADQIRAALIEEQAHVARMNRIDEAVRVATEFGTDMRAAGERLGIEVQSFEPFAAFSPPMEIREHARLWNQLQAAEPGRILSATKEGDTILAVVSDTTPPRPQELEEVRDRIQRELESQKLQQLTFEKAQEIAESARQGGGDLAKAASAVDNLRVRTTGFFARSDTVPGLGAASSLGEEPFFAEIGEVVGPVASGNSQVVYRVAERQDADMNEFGGEQDEFMKNELEQRRQEAMQIYQAAARARYEEQGLIKRYDDRISTYLISLARTY